MQQIFNDAMLNVRMSPIVAISEEVRKKSADFTRETGKQFILFQRGEIDFPTPQHIIEAAKRAMDAGHTKYPKSGGEDFLKDAILTKLRSYNKAEGLTRDSIVVTYGGQEALELAFNLFAGKRGAGFAPCWSCVLENFVPYARIDFIEVPLEHDFSINMRKLEETLKTVSFFYLNTPQNPTGKVFSEDEVRRVVDLCVHYGVYVISDEAYERIIYDGRRYFSPLSIPQDNIIGTYTLSKTYSMTGWRLGYLVTRNSAVAKLIRLGDYTQTAGVVTFLQHAAKEALENAPASEASLALMVGEYQKRRDALVEGLNQMKGLELRTPEGAFYVFPDFGHFIPSDLEPQKRSLYIYERLMSRGVATVYGSCFGKHFANNIRISFSTTPANAIREGLMRIAEAFA